MIVGSIIRRFGPRHIAIAGVGVILVLAFSIIAGLSSINWNFTLTGIDITVQYGASDQGYFGPAQQSFPVISGSLNANLSVKEAGFFMISFSFSELALENGSDGITKIKAESADSLFSFQVTSVNPALPIVFTPGKTILINVSVKAPYYGLGQSCPAEYCPHGPYVGPIDLVLTTTNS